MAEKVVGIKYSYTGLRDIIQQQDKARESLERVKKATEDLRATTDKARQSYDAARKTAEQWVAQTRQQYTSLKQVEAQLRQVSAAIQGLRSSQSATTSETQQQIQQLRQQQWALRQVRDEYKQSEQAQRQATQGWQRSTSAIAMNAKKMVLWAVGAASAYRLFMKIRSELMEGIREVYGNTEEYKRLTDALRGARNAFILLILPQEQTLKLMGEISGSLEDLAQKWLETSASMQAIAKVGFRSVYDAMASLGNLFEATIGIFTKSEPLFAGFSRRELERLEETGRYSKYLEEYDRYLEENRRLWEESMQSADEATSKIESALSSVISMASQWDDELEENKKRIDEINQALAEARATAETEYADRIIEIQRDLNKRIDKINADANKARDKAIRNANRSIENAIAQSNLNIERMIAQHNLAMEHAQQRHALQMVQNERMYLYERSKLVAEGDVLAIEDLDARYELEQQAQEENFRLQQQQAEAMFQLQLRYMREAQQEQIQAIRDALAEQLREIEENRQERIQEAQEGAAEEREEARQAREEQIADAEEAHEEQTAAEEEAMEKRRERLGQQLAAWGRDNELSAEQVTAIWEAHYGKDAPVERAIRDAYARYETYAKAFGPVVQDAMRQAADATQQEANRMVVALDAATAAALRTAAAIQAIQRTGGGGRTPTYGGGGGYRPYQYGGDTVVSTPTPIMAGEAGPERVTITPLSPIGGNLTLSWHGNPIPVHGTGEFTGADLGAMGDAIASGLFTELQSTILRYHGQRGR